MNFACQVVGDNIRTANAVVIGALRSLASPAGKKPKPTNLYERITFKTIASKNAHGPQRQTSLVPNHRVARMETRTTWNARVRQC
jgi:hypothetical protein